jgi:hypothetical protein
MAVRKKGQHAKVERTIVRGQDVWHVRSEKSGHTTTVTTKPASKLSMEKAKVLYGRALRRLAHR